MNSSVEKDRPIHLSYARLPDCILTGGVVTRAKAHDAVRWFAGCGGRYVEAYLGHVDVQRLAVDRDYGLKLFFFTWAFERVGAPRAYRIAAVKAVSSLKGSQAELPRLFGEFCAGKTRERGKGPESRFWKGGVPTIDPKIVDFDVRNILQLVAQGAIEEAFHKVVLKGLGHKLRALFLRDLVTLLKAEPKLGADHDAYLWCQPIDVWVRFAAEELCGTRTTNSLAARGSGKYGLGRADLAAASGIVELSIQAGVSPLRVNQGIWYFSANAVADEARLRALIRGGEPRELDAELELMKGFLPTRPMWG